MIVLIAADVSIKSILGGAERVLYEESTGLAKRGHDVSIITRRLPIHSAEHETIDGVNEYRYEVDMRNSFTFIFSTLLNSRKLFLSLIKKKSFDIINFHQPFTASGINLTKASKKIQKVYTCHSLAFEEYETRHTKTGSIFSVLNYILNSRFRRYIEKRNILKSHKIVVLSKFTEKKLITNYCVSKKMVEVVPGAVDLCKFHPVENAVKLMIRKEMSVPSSKFIFFTVRNLVPRMGLDKLILSVGKILKEAEDLYLVIGGEGVLRNDLGNLIAEKKLESYIKITGFIPEDKLPMYYQMADFFILPTQYLEGFGMVTLEAMASGTPAIGTNVGGTVEILSKFNKNLLIKGTDTEAIADSILSCYRLFRENPESLASLSKECRRYVENNYSWDVHITRLEEIFKEGPLSNDSNI